MYTGSKRSQNNVNLQRSKEKETLQTAIALRDDMAQIHDADAQIS
jgi:hypothetical protein